MTAPTAPAPYAAAPNDAERLARATLSRIAEPGSPPLARLVRARGPEQVLADLRDGEPTPGVDADALRHRLAAADTGTDLARADAVGARYVCPGDPDWPQALDDLAWADLDCLGLWVRGTLPADPSWRAVSIVGARSCSDYGRLVATDFAFGLVERGWTVVSGLALGIDAAAHHGALLADGTTIAALASGVDAPYPQANRALYERICVAGAVVSEYPPGAAPMRPRFLVRNRLVAALSAGTVVVEMGLRSGAATTARYADELNRHVMVVPGPITAPASAGCHQLLRRQPGAVVVTRVEEVIEQCGPMGEVAPDLAGPVRPRDLLGPMVRRVYEAVPVSRPIPAERIAATAGVTVAAAAASLAALSQLGVAENRDGGWVMTGAGRAERRHDPTVEPRQLPPEVW